MDRVIVGITGATGTIYGVRLMEMLRRTDAYEIHLVMSRSAKLTLKMEHDVDIADINALATRCTRSAISGRRSRPAPSIRRA